jgi:membrane peptidoglycan carboxypeptidase
MIQRRTRPSFSKDDKERLLAYLDVTRNLTINYGAAYGFHSPQYALKTSLNAATDKLAEQITGDPQFFHMSHHSAGGQPSPSDAALARQKRELLWQELRRKY